MRGAECSNEVRDTAREHGVRRGRDVGRVEPEQGGGEHHMRQLHAAIGVVMCGRDEPGVGHGGDGELDGGRRDHASIAQERFVFVTLAVMRREVGCRESTRRGNDSVERFA